MHKKGRAKLKRLRRQNAMWKNRCHVLFGMFIYALCDVKKLNRIVHMTPQWVERYYDPARDYIRRNGTELFAQKEEILFGKD